MENMLHLFRNATTRRRYHTIIQAQIQADPLLGLLPSLPDLPLLSSEGRKLHASWLIEQGHYVALRGPIGSGRSLALFQLVVQFAAQDPNEPVLLLALARSDKINLPPRNVFTILLHEMGLTITLDDIARATKNHPWTLLIDEWEELSPARQAVWRTFLLSLPKLLPDVRVIVTLPDTDEKWTDFETITMAMPNESLIEQWLSCLLPHQDIHPLLQSLAPGSPLYHLRSRLLDIVLLALTYPVNGLPTNRLQLYERAYHLFRGVVAERTDVSHLSSQRQGGHGQLSNPNHPILRQRTYASQIHSAIRATILTRALLLMQCYELAQIIAHTHAWDLFTYREDTPRFEVALLLSGMMDDPAPIYAELWEQVHAKPANLLILGHCLCEYPTKASKWGIDVLELLVARKPSPSYLKLLQNLGTVLPILFKDLDETFSDERVDMLLSNLAPIVGIQPLLDMLDHSGIRPSLRWATADILVPLAPGTTLLKNTQSLDVLSQAARCYILALGTTQDRLILTDTKAVGWIVALRDNLVPPQRCIKAIHALMQDGDTPPVLRATALTLLAQDHNETTLSTLKHMCFDQHIAVRYAALTTLRSCLPEQTWAILREVILMATDHWEIQRDALDYLARDEHDEITIILARFVLSRNLPLVGQLYALKLMVGRKNMHMLLYRLLTSKTLHDVVRAAIIHLLGTATDKHMVHEFQHLANHDKPELVQQAAILALGMIGAQHSDDKLHTKILAHLKAILFSSCNISISECVLQALGMIGSLSAIPILQRVLNNHQGDAMQQAWRESIPQLDTIPVHQWAERTKSSSVRVSLLTALTEGKTNADQPSSLEELIKQSTSRIRIAAANALLCIGKKVDVSHHAIVGDIFFEALSYAYSSQEICHLLSCMKQMGDDLGLSILERLLIQPKSDARVFWFAIEQLGETLETDALLCRYVEQPQSDSFTKAIVVRKLARRGVKDVLPVFHHIATCSDENLHLRMQTIIAIGELADPRSIPILLSLITDTQVPALLRGAAAKAMPRSISAEVRHALRDLLRRTRQIPELVEGLLFALGQSCDNEALALILSYAQHEHTPIALAALGALAEIENESVAPELVRIVQDSRMNESVQLQAVITLLRLCGEEYLPFLRGFLDCGVLPLQLRALDELLTMWPTYSQPLILVASKFAPLGLRLRALEEVVKRQEHHHVLCELLLDNHEPPQLRANIAAMLGHTNGTEVIESLYRCAREETTPPLIRRHCVTALSQQARSSLAWAIESQCMLARLVDDLACAVEVRVWSAHALLSAFQLSLRRN